MGHRDRSQAQNILFPTAPPQHPPPHECGETTYHFRCIHSKVQVFTDHSWREGEFLTMGQNIFASLPQYLHPHPPTPHSMRLFPPVAGVSCCTKSINFNPFISHFKWNEMENIKMMVEEVIWKTTLLVTTWHHKHLRLECHDIISHGKRFTKSVLSTAPNGREVEIHLDAIRGIARHCYSYRQRLLTV